MRSTPCLLLMGCTYIFEPPDLPDTAEEHDSPPPTLAVSGDATEPLSPDAAWSAGPDDNHDQFADSVASAGDVNGDGFDDIVIGSYNSGESSASVFLGSGMGPETVAHWDNETSNQADSRFGLSVASAGDVNNDGYDDVLVGAPFFDGGIVDEGKAFLYLGAANGLGAEHVWYSESEQTSAHHGHVVASAGDVNQDGFADIVVGAPHYDIGSMDEGKASVYLGAPVLDGQAAIADVELIGTPLLANFGWSVASAGDVNDDGWDDVIVGAPLYDGALTEDGIALLYFGSSSGLQTSAAWGMESDQAYSGFGYSVASAGDVDADGFADVIVGARSFDSGEDNEGRAFLYRGSDVGLPPAADWTAEPNYADAEYGTAVASAGDVNADGYADVVVGAPAGADALDFAGKVYVHLGSALGLGAIEDWSAEPEQDDSRFGATVAAAGDVNGDGYGDLIIGAPTRESGSNFGHAFVYLGQCYDASADSDGDGVGDACDLCVGDNASGDVDQDGICGKAAGSESPGPGVVGQGRGCNGGSTAGGIPLAALAFLLTRSAPARTSAPSSRNTTRPDPPSPRARKSWPSRRPRRA